MNLITAKYKGQNSSSQTNPVSASQEIPHIYGNWRFITVLAKARYLSLS